MSSANANDAKTKPFDARAHRIAGHALRGRKIAVLTIDVEHDYNGAGDHALNRLPEVVGAASRAGLPLTAFVEGRLFREREDLCAALAEGEADLQLHCYDHRGHDLRVAGDDDASLRRGAEGYERFVGAPPQGYRAHTYRLTEELFETLLACGFRWDSSVLPALGRGAQRGAAAFRAGDWFVIDEALVELPLAAWRPWRIPFTQAYRQLAGPAAEALLRATATLPPLLVYDMHMTDLVPDGRLRDSPLPPWMKAAHGLVRWRQRGLSAIAALGEALSRQGYEWMTMSQCHEALRPLAGLRPTTERAMRTADAPTR